MARIEFELDTDEAERLLNIVLGVEDMGWVLVAKTASGS